MARYVPKVDYGRLEFEYVPSSGFYRARISTDNSFKKDTDYTVVFDGRKYTVRATANGAIGGNAYLYDQRKPDTGEPFYLAPAMGLVMASTAGFHFVSYGIMKADGNNVDERLDGLEQAVVELSEEIDTLKENDGVKSVNGVEPDENGNVEIDIPEGFSGSWNDLTDRPFYENRTTVYDSVIKSLTKLEGYELYSAPLDGEFSSSRVKFNVTLNDFDEYNNLTRNIVGYGDELMGAHGAISVIGNASLIEDYLRNEGPDGYTIIRNLEDTGEPFAIVVFSGSENSMTIYALGKCAYGRTPDCQGCSCR